MLAIEGEKNRIVAVAFKPIDKPVEAPPPEAPGTSSGPPTIAYVIGGAGVVALGVGVGLWLSGKSAHDRMESGCARTQSCSRSDVDSAKSPLLIGDVAAGIGVVAIGAAVVILLTSRGSAPPRAAHLDVKPVSGGGLASFSTRF